MRLLSILALALLPLLLLVALPSQAFAHGLGQSQNLPLHFCLYLFAAAAVVLVSFIQISVSVNEQHTLARYPRRNLLAIGALRAVLTSRPLLIGLRLLSVVLFLLVIISGIFGVQAPSLNFAPTFVWIIWWVGLSFFTAFVGNIWPLINPWRVLFEWAEGLARVFGIKRRLHLGEKYPESWGIWPALVLYAGFIWIENDFAGSATPLYLALRGPVPFPLGRIHPGALRVPQEPPPRCRQAHLPQVPLPAWSRSRVPGRGGWRRLGSHKHVHINVHRQNGTP